MIGAPVKLTIDLTAGGEQQVIECRWVYVRDMCLTYAPVDLPEGTTIGIPLLKVDRYMTYEAPRIIGTASVGGSGATAVF